MKNMKKLPLIVLIGSLSACGGSDYGMSGVSGAGGTGNLLLAETTTSTPPAAPGAAAPAASNAYLVDLYQHGLAEIQLAQLALQRATNDDVRQYAQRIIEHHTAANSEITQLAQSKNITLPSTPAADAQTQVSILTALPSDQFDLAYLQTNIAMHDADIAAARLQAQSGTDAEIRRLARYAVPILKVHLGAAEEIAGLLDPAAFLATAYRTGLAEIQLGQLALQRATNDDVREFAQQMIDEHTQANTQISTLAQQRGFPLPTALSAEQQATATELATFTGADFDEAYMDINVIAHLQAVRLFRKQADAGTDADVRAFASNNVPDLTEHLLSALEVDRAVEPSFAFRAYQDGEAEIAASLLAQRRASSEDVRAYAQRMIAEHSAANAQLQTQAQQGNRALPTDFAPEHLVAIVQLTQTSGEQFDRLYMDLNARVHENDVTAAGNAAQQGADAISAAAAQAALPVLTEHLTRARTLREQLANADQASGQ